MRAICHSITKAASRRALTSVAVLALLVGSAATAVEVNRVVLRVNDRIATLHDFEVLKRERLSALVQAPLPEAEKQQRIAELGVMVMKELFDELLLLSRADQLGVRSEESKLAAALEQAKKNFGISSDEEFEQALAANRMTREEFRERVETSLLIRDVLGRDVYSKIELEDEDLRRYYREHPEEFSLPARRLLREVVVLEAGRSEEELRATAEDLRRSIASGAGDEVVSDLEGRGVATGWIDLGWVEVGHLDPQLEAALADLGPGDVSEPTPARGGLHVLQVLELEEESVKAFDEVSDEIEIKLSDARFGEAMDGYMRDLAEKAYIESDPPPDAAGFRSRESGPRPRVDPLEAQMAAQRAREAAAEEAAGSVTREGEEVTTAPPSEDVASPPVEAPEQDPQPPAEPAEQEPPPAEAPEQTADAEQDAAPPPPR